MTRAGWQAVLRAALARGDRALLRAGLDDPAALEAWLASVPRPARRRRWPAVLALLALLVLPALSQDSPAALALVNGQPLSQSSYLGWLEQRRGAELADAAVLGELVRQAAARAGLSPTAGELDGAWDRILQQQFRYSETRYQQWLRAGGRSEAVLREEIAVQVAQMKLRGRGVSVTEAALQAYFQEHQAAYEQPASLEYRQLVVPPTGAKVDGLWPASRTKALEIIAAVRDGLAFEAALARFGEDPTAAASGGLVGPVPTAQLAAQSAVVSAALEPLVEGQVAPEPVLLGDRYQVLQLVRRTPAQPADYQRQRALVEADYLTTRLQPQEQFVAQLLAGATVQWQSPRYAGRTLSGRWVSPNGLTLPGWLRERL
ncbi:MAG: peptidyl-prolyl cis-trans isomerase [Fimbriimonadaceae bacterium]|nr:peptidyl-prolyl cis-trans isomerase [Fimbriimonadaceae bacterium]